MENIDQVLDEISSLEVSDQIARLNELVTELENMLNQ